MQYSEAYLGQADGYNYESNSHEKEPFVFDRALDTGRFAAAVSDHWPRAPG